MTQAELRAEVAKVPGARFESGTDEAGHLIEGVWLRRDGKDYELSFDFTNNGKEVAAAARDRMADALRRMAGR